MSRVLFVASEAVPFASTGGLSDVIAALPPALAGLGHQVAVLMPRYARTRPFPMRRIWGELPVTLGEKTYFTSIFQSEENEAFLFLDYPEFYDRDGIYGDASGDYPDNELRFALLSRAALEVSRNIFLPDVLHCHDWQAALTPLYLKQMPFDPTFYGMKTLLTIHNLGYQGLFPPSVLPSIGVDPKVFEPAGAEFWGKVSFLKTGIVFSDALNTVSPTYAQEIQTPEYGFGLDGVLRSRGAAVSGILNGVEYERWSPETDSAIPARFSNRDLSGKQVCKVELLRELNLSAAAADKPLFGVVSRLTSQKGADLIARAIPALFAAEDAYLVALGSGEPYYESIFRDLAGAFPDRVAVVIGYDDALAHRIEAGSDIFLMPSQYEPCGLNQMYSLRYGTVPVVRATGGLEDTINAATGFKFVDYSAEALLGALRDALEVFRDRPAWETLMHAGMARDFSWSVAAGRYASLYDILLNPGAKQVI